MLKDWMFIIKTSKKCVKIDLRNENVIKKLMEFVYRKF